jgi:hypothetical protein
MSGGGRKGGRGKNEHDRCSGGVVGDKCCDGDGGGNISGNAASVPVGYDIVVGGGVCDVCRARA